MNLNWLKNNFGKDPIAKLFGFFLLGLMLFAELTTPEWWYLWIGIPVFYFIVFYVFRNNA